MNLLNLHIGGIDYESISDGEGCRCTIFISGCCHNCKGCHNADCHDFNYGELVTDALIDEINQELDKRPYLSGITISGGDSMFSAYETLKFIKALHVPKNNIWIYSGFTYAEIVRDKYKLELLEMCDVLVDDRFEIDKRDVTLKFCGSSNQRIIDVKKSLEENKVVLLGDD